MTAAEHNIEDLRGPENERYQSFDYAVQAIARVGFVLILIAALFGLFGQGFFSQHHEAAEDGSLSLTYEAIDRYENPTTLKISIDALPRDATSLRLSFSRAFCDATTPEAIIPAPTKSTLQGDNIVYEFAVNDLQEAEVVYRYKHDEPGALNYEVAVEGRTPVTVQQYVLP